MSKAIDRDGGRNLFFKGVSGGVMLAPRLVLLRSPVVRCALVVSFLLGEPAQALADLVSIPLGRKGISYSYEVEGISEFPTALFVTYPSSCGRDARPVWVAPSDERRTRGYLAYEVLIPAHRSVLERPCEGGTFIYALAASRFTFVPHSAARSEGRPRGFKRDEAYGSLRQLDTCVGDTCESFFRPPWAQRLDYRLAPVWDASVRSSLAAVHDVLAVRRLPSGRFELSPVRARYTYEDGAGETLPFGPQGERPPPAMAGREHARTRSGTDADEAGVGSRASSSLADFEVSAPQEDDRRVLASSFAGAALLMLAGVVCLARQVGGAR